MSIARQLLREFRPLFRMLDEPFGRFPAYYPSAAIRHQNHDSFFADPFSAFNVLNRPAVDVTEKGNNYVINADLPGISKENLQVRVGDGNQSITIEGKVVDSSSTVMPDTVTEANADAKAGTRDSDASAEYTDASKSTSATKKEDSIETEISVERPYSRNYSFSRTVWLPRPVDPQNVTAKLQNGVLSVTLNKAVDNTSKVITVEDA